MGWGKQPPNINSRYMQGYFSPRNPQKYRGNASRIVYRSSWELAFLNQLDSNTNVLEYSSEELKIPYQDQSTKDHQGNFSFRLYHPDFLVRYKDQHGKVRTVLIEIKPLKETQAPKQTKKGRRMLTEAKTYIRNMCKWKAAQAYCRQRGWEFKIVTEINLGQKLF